MQAPVWAGPRLRGSCARGLVASSALAPSWETGRGNKKPTFLCAMQNRHRSRSPVTMVTLCFLNWGGGGGGDVATAFWGSQTSSRRRDDYPLYFLNLKMMLVQSVCVCVCVGVWHTCVRICIIYIHSIYYIYKNLLFLRRVAMVTSHSAYVSPCSTPTSASPALLPRFPWKPSKVTLRTRERAQREDMGNSLIWMKSNVHVIGWLRFGHVLNCEKSDELMKSYLQPIEKCSVRLFLCLVQNMTIYQLSLLWSWFGFGKLL